ncbi:hypothetical protein [Flavobacterium sp.]|uniref:hypothetical protein n=1 Tax=Flavobacterium sp. TaxID=239 RepID=UPI0025BA6B50|nr:hypothetical protein [Flavobacterium sp.]
MKTLENLSASELRNINGGGLGIVFSNSTTDEDGATSTTQFGLQLDDLFDDVLGI